MLQELGRDEYVRALTDHRRLLRAAFARHGGVEVEMQGDSFFVAFAGAGEAVAAAEEAQVALSDHPWRHEPIHVRIGIHTGEPIVNDGLYAGLDVHRAARVMSAGHGDQVLVSQTTRDLIDDDFELRDLGAHRLKDLSRPVRLYQLGDREFPPLKTLDATNLPVAASPLVGREQELEELVELLSNGTRLLTITGPGGTGKTRLALQAAAELTGSFADGVFWVPLVALTAPDQVVPAIAQTIGAGGRLADHVRDRHLLLLVDNAEHVVAAGPAVAELVAAAPKLRLLVTSRAPLHVSAEREYPLEPLPTTDAVTLFVERGRSVGRKLEPSETVDAICRRVDRLPLAIELAAARTKLLAPDKLLERLDRALPLLTEGARDAPDRQRTLTATIEWSYDLLEEDAQRLFARLSVFTGTFSLEAAEEISDAELDTLAALVDLSLLKPIGATRFFMLETIREYAASRLEQSGERERLSDRHAEWFVEIAAEGMPSFGQANAGPAIDRVAAELSNLRAALAHIATAEPERALRLAVALGWFWNARAPLEGWHVLQSLYSPDVDPQLRVDALGSLGFFALQADEWEEVERCAQERLELARSIGDRNAECQALSLLGHAARRAGQAAKADALEDEAVAIARALGDPKREAHAIWFRGAGEQEWGDPEVALALFEESLAVATVAGEQGARAWSWATIGATLCRLRRFAEARPPLQDAVRYFVAAGEMKAFANCIDHLALVAVAAGDESLGARLLGAGDGVWRSMGVPLEEAYRPSSYFDEALAALEGSLGEQYESERAAGAELTVEEAVVEALSMK
jgi:predicted ATPase